MKKNPIVSILPDYTVRAGQELTIVCSAEGDTEASAHFLLTKDGEKTPFFFLMEIRDNQYCCKLRIEETGLYFFCIKIGQDTIRQDDDGNPVTEGGSLFQLTVYDRDYIAPSQLEGGVLYQIFPDRFAIGEGLCEMPFSDRILHVDLDDLPDFRPDSEGKVQNNDYFGGNFRGIIEKIGYLKSLGVTGIYLNPITEAHSNHRYDTANYKAPDPLLGTENEFRQLCDAAHAAGMRIILDGVFNHTGADSIYFNRGRRYSTVGAYQSKDSPYYSWYYFDRFPDKYRSWWNFETLPELNEDDPALRDYICGEEGVIDYWMCLGADGFRLDVADELPDGFIEDIRKAVKRHGNDKILIGEVWENASNKISYDVRRAYLQGRELDSVMNYPFRTAILDFVRDGDAALWMRRVREIDRHYPKPMLNLMMNMLSNHDTERALSALAVDPEEWKDQDKEWLSKRVLTREEYLRGIEMMKLAMVLQFTLPGLPCIYYGDEIGMQGFKDPFNRCFMRWNDGDKNLRDFTVNLAEIRAKHMAFKNGVFVPVAASNSLVAFLRKSADETVAVAVNRAKTAQTIYFPDGEQWRLEPWDYRIDNLPRR